MGAKLNLTIYGYTVTLQDRRDPHEVIKRFYAWTPESPYQGGECGENFVRKHYSGFGYEVMKVEQEEVRYVSIDLEGAYKYAGENPKMYLGSEVNGND
ncbi:hypothetical protein [Anaerotruncus rubiinfantis]|uniref:hypothetical protein n=1 Tax=Anaerotruncus rubiinfantis TaxID=1720200 RepID=UPI003D7A87FD